MLPFLNTKKHPSYHCTTTVDRYEVSASPTHHLFLDFLSTLLLYEYCPLVGSLAPAQVISIPLSLR